MSGFQENLKLEFVQDAKALTGIEKKRLYQYYYRLKNHNIIREQARLYYKQNKEKILARKKSEPFAKKRRLWMVDYRQKMRIEVLTHYSNGIPKCSCCGETHLEFLSIDHSNGKGTKHRKEVKSYGNAFYFWLKKNNYPADIQVLCHNCNLAKGFYGYCPHKI